MNRWPFLLPVLMLASACQAPPFSPDSPLSAVPVNSTLILHQRLEIPPNTVSLWYQNGRQISQDDVEHYDPHCKFETSTMETQAKTIEPDSFVIYKVLRWDDLQAMQSIKLAASRHFNPMTLGGGGSYSFLNMATEMYLRSSNQPDVYRLTCSHWEDPGFADHVTINQMRAALGDTFTLQMPANMQP